MREKPENCMKLLDVGLVKHTEVHTEEKEGQKCT